MFGSFLNSSLTRCLSRSKHFSAIPYSKFFSTSFKSEMARLYDNIDKDQSDGKVMDLQNGVFFFKTPKNAQFGYKSLVKLQDNTPAIVLSLTDSVSAALLLKDSQIQVGDQVDLTFEGQKGVFTNVDPLNFGKIVNYLGLPINQGNVQGEGVKVNVFSAPSQKFERAKIDAQLFTGNIAVDFTKPLAKGNFILFQGNANTGKTHLAAQTAINFIKNKFLDPSKRAKKVIYVNVNINETNTIWKDLVDAECESDAIAFSVDSKLPSNTYFAPLAALAYANYLKSKDTDVLLIFDDMVEHYVKEMLIFNTVNQPFAPFNIVNELYASTGAFTTGSLSTVLIYDSNQAQPELQASLKTYHTHIESLCDVKIDFDFSDPVYKNVLPRIDVVAANNFYSWMPKIVHVYAKALAQLLKELGEEKDTMVKKKELNIHVDPWDCYLFLDSTYFMKLLINSRKMNIIEELVLVGFTMRAIESDTISYFKDDPRVLVDEIFKFAKELKEFENTDLITYIYRILNRDVESSSPISTIVESINRFYELFFLHCKMQSRLLPYKKDYFS